MIYLPYTTVRSSGPAISAAAPGQGSGQSNQRRPVVVVQQDRPGRPRNSRPTPDNPYGAARWERNGDGNLTSVDVLA